MHFQPSPHSYGSFGPDYGILGLSKAERRDRKERQATNKMDKYRKCIDKGKGESKCAKYKDKAKKRLSRSRELDAKLGAKKPSRTKAKQAETFAKLEGTSTDTAAKSKRTGSKGGKLVGRMQGGGAGGGSEELDMMSDEEMEMEAGELEQSSGGSGGFLLPLIGLLVVGGGAFAVWKMRS